MPGGIEEIIPSAGRLKFLPGGPARRGYMYIPDTYIIDLVLYKYTKYCSIDLLLYIYIYRNTTDLALYKYYTIDLVLYIYIYIYTVYIYIYIIYIYTYSIDLARYINPVYH